MGLPTSRPLRALRNGHARSVMVTNAELERLGLATSIGPAQCNYRKVRTVMLFGERGDIIKRIHRRLTEQRIERSVGEFSLDSQDTTAPIVGQLVTRGLDDELKGTAYAVIDGIDGRAHHVRLADIDATSDTSPGGIVELRRFVDATGRPRVALAVRSDLPIEAQVHANGATWLDRQLVTREPASLSSGGFGREVREAMDARVEHLIGQGLARREGQRVIFVGDLLDNLRQRELDATALRSSQAPVCLCCPAGRASPSSASIGGASIHIRPLRHDRQRTRIQLGPLEPVARKALGRQVRHAQVGRIEWSQRGTWSKYWLDRLQRRRLSDRYRSFVGVGRTLIDAIDPNRTLPACANY